MSQTRLLNTIVAILAVALVACACDPADGSDPIISEESDITMDGDHVAIARYTVHVDLTDPDNPVMEFVPEEIDGADQGSGAQGVATQAETSVLADVSLYGPATWDAGTETLSASVRITNNGGAELDEPYAEVLDINVDTVVFQGIHGGGGGVGSRYGYADIETGPSAANNASARQDWRIHAPGATPFSFGVDILVADTISAIWPDADDDRFNEEDESEPAGGDCNDDNPAQSPVGYICLPPVDPDDNDLRLALEFEGNASCSSYWSNDANASSLSYGVSVDGSGAGDTQSSTAIEVDYDSSSLNLSAVTIEMWINPDSSPSSGRYGLLERDNKWGFYWYGNELRCLVGTSSGVPTVNGGSIPVGQWSHVACTYQRNVGHVLYVNGVAVDSGSASRSARTGSGDIRVAEEAPGGGDQFLGLIDRVHVWDRALSASEIRYWAGLE